MSGRRAGVQELQEFRSCRSSGVAGVQELQELQEFRSSGVPYAWHCFSRGYSCKVTRSEPGRVNKLLIWAKI
jgi:hypothetical protein